VSSERVDLVRSRFEGFNDRDWEASIAGSSHSIEWVVSREHPASRTLRGFDEIHAYQEDWLQTMPGLKLQIDEIDEVGQSVVAIGRAEGSGAGSGAEVGVPIAFVCRFEGAEVVRVEEYLDLQEARRAA
jgi:ketosteroid isomerase-like protein